MNTLAESQPGSPAALTVRLLQPANRVVMDYARLKPAAGDKERRAILTVARKPLFPACYALFKT